MGSADAKTRLAEEVRAHLARALSQVTVSIRPESRWRREVVEVVWPGFAGMLPEQRFRLVVDMLPRRLFITRLRGLIWLERTPAEDLEDYLALPRSEDVAARRDALLKEMVQAGLFPRLAQRVDAKKASAKTATTDLVGGLRFEETRAVLKTLGMSAAQIEDCCLCLIAVGAFTDCEALAVGMPQEAGVDEGDGREDKNVD